MFPRGAAHRSRPAAHSSGPYPPPPAPQYYENNRQRLPAANSYSAPSLKRLSNYEWKSPPYVTSLPTPIRGKRRIEDRSPQVLKRQRLDSSPHPQLPPPSGPTPRLPPRPGHALPGASQSSSSGFYPSPQPSPWPQVHPVQENCTSLQTYAKDKLSSQMVELFEPCHQQLSDLTLKERYRTRLQLDIQRVYAAARLYLTGSSMNGLGCRSSDADLCLVLPGRPNPIHVLSVLQRMFKSLPYVERTLLIRAKVPILRFKDKDSHLQFDLNINNTVGIRNTFLLRSYANADIRIKPMILVIKKWAWHHKINDASKGTLSSYTLVLMTLHYLQTLNEPVIPCLQKDHPECFNPFVEVDMIPEGSKHVPQYVSRNQSSLGDLLLGFLKYYATDFRWDRQVISVREAKALPRNDCREWRNKYICVEEPFERNNVARAVYEKFKFDIIRAQFAESYRTLRDLRDLNSILPIRAVINKELGRK